MANLKNIKTNRSTEQFAQEAKSMESILNIMDIASELRKKTEDAQMNLDMDITIDTIKKTVLDSAKFKGESLTEEQVDTAVNHYISQMYKFEEPVNNFDLKLARAYVDRKKIGRRYGIPTLAVAGTSLAIWGIVNLSQAAYIKKSESNTEKAVMEAYTTKAALEGKVITFSSAKTAIIDASDVLDVSNDVKSALNKTTVFFETYCPNGNAKETVTKSNYESVKNELSGIVQTLDLAKTNSIKGDALLSTDKEFVGVKSTLDVTMSEITNTRDVPQKLLALAETNYKSGIESIKSLNLESAVGYKNALSGIQTNIRDFAVLPSQLIQAYASIRSVVKEDAALTKADAIYRDGQVQVNAVNVPTLTNDVKQLKDLDAILRQEYTLKIVSREGEKSGIDRYSNNNNNNAVSYYLIVEAVDKDGNVIPQRITNIEDSRRSGVVKTWGEKVPEAVYEGLKSDKMDDGIIQNNIFAVKEKGYINDKIVMKGPNGQPLKRVGQITEW